MFEIELLDLNTEEIQNLIGVNDKNIKYLSSLYECNISLRGNKMMISDISEESFDLLKQHLNFLIKLCKNNEIDETFIKQSYNSNNRNMNDSTNNLNFYTTAGKMIKPRNIHQAEFLRGLENNDLMFSIGPAGTGKTFLAVVLAVKAFKNGEVNKIVLSRPAVEAGESLGFLPGDLKEKVDPYLIPLYDSLYALLGNEQTDRLIEKGDIEIIPLAYMRGRTLNDSFVVLDEAQNTTPSQMLMFLTRLGSRSKMIVEGDITQIDLNISKQQSGLITALNSLKNIKEISFVEFDNNDIVRSPLVQKIIESFNN